jgi:hypothetical protein
MMMIMMMMMMMMMMMIIIIISLYMPWRPLGLLEVEAPTF